MKKIALTAFAVVALPLTSIPTVASARPAADVAPDHAAGGKLAVLLSTDPAAVAAGRERPIRVGIAGVPVTEPVRVALRPADVRREQAEKAARERAARVRRVASRGARSAAPSARGATARGRATTIASWYDVRPSACWDRRGRHAFPRGLRIWTAHKTLPCGTMVVVTGPSGSMTVGVWDRGPYVAGRSLDLSAAAFRRVCGSTSRGVCRVSWRAA